MKLHKYRSDKLLRLVFECETDGSQSFKANRSPVQVQVTLERQIAFGSAYQVVGLVATYLFPARKYTWAKLNHYATQCIDRLEAGKELEGQLEHVKITDAAALTPR